MSKMDKFLNKTTYKRSMKNGTNFYVMFSAKLSELPGYERLIMYELLSHSDDYVINKKTIFKNTGFPVKKFNDAWRSLENKNYIIPSRLYAGIHWIIIEDPSENGQ